MKILGRLAVFPTLPPRIERLYELAYNLWWVWNPGAQALYAQVSAELWEGAGHNAVATLAGANPERLEALAADTEFLARYDAVLAEFDAYMHPASTWFSEHHASDSDHVIAYFSAEFGLHESLPIYSGGLGILSGDHCKEASDLGLPFVGVGFLYPQGYFRQRITREGQQEAIYEKLDFSQAPARPARDAHGHEVLISVELPGRSVFAKVWKVQVGRVPLYLMDTDVPQNAPADRVLSARLYGGDQEMRIAQEIVLGIGGVRALRALGIDASVWHMNEGHAAFLGLERCRELVNGLDVDFEVARQIAAANAVFTTHTPVAAGNDVFSFDLVERYFSGFWPQLRLDRDAFMNLAREDAAWGSGFSMTILAIRLSAQRNGVSRLHGHVSREMWSFLWPDIDATEAPIGHVTNGVHTASWLNPTLGALYDRYLAPGWRGDVDNAARWERVADIPDQELWEAHCEAKEQLIAYARRRLARQRLRHGEGPALSASGAALNPEALTLGFARRFATYKRATLLFRDPDRLARILNDPERPVQIIFAGKAHPADGPGQDFIRQVYAYAQTPEFAGKIVFLEDYDIDTARRLVSGCDVWLNTPVRPHEASGTSGQKAGLNGLPNSSVLDGWWEEGYNGANGWAIGEPHSYMDANTRDAADALALYDTIERAIVPLYYQRDAGDLPRQWIAVMKEAIRTVAPAFSMSRMVKQYYAGYYQPAIRYGERVDADRYALARELAAWTRRVREAWGETRIEAEGPSGERLAEGEPAEVRARVWLGSLTPNDVRVEIVTARDENGNLRDQRVIAMERAGGIGAAADGALEYTARMDSLRTGGVVYGVRLVPTHPGLSSPVELGLARWA
ncbi:MAG TPA: alpha-glucan family phosphorylase [Ktedonobacterales bacterium]|nr:alpha-glucan family phosphorylase [Ktedonobacterales bacterium]